ncbi:unnamed protein product [Caretta caretta]
MGGSSQLAMEESVDEVLWPAICRNHHLEGGCHRMLLSYGGGAWSPILGPYRLLRSPLDSWDSAISLPLAQGRPPTTTPGIPCSSCTHSLGSARLQFQKIPTLPMACGNPDSSTQTFPGHNPLRHLPQGGTVHGNRKADIRSQIPDA